MIETAYLFPAIGAAAGIAGGAAADIYAARAIAGERASLNETWGNVVDAPRTGLRAIGPMAITGFFAVGILGAAWAPEATPAAPRSQLEVVIDHSGATAIGEPSAAAKINAVAESFAGAKFVTEAVVARSGEVRIIKTGDVSHDAPFGDAPLDQAVQTALDNVQRAREQGKLKPQEKTAGAVVVTNGNTIGDVTAVIARAKSAGTSVNIVNVEERSTDATTSELQRVTAETGGTYWNSADADPAKIYDKIAPTVTPGQTQEKRPTSWPKRILGSLPLIALPVMWRWRRNMAATPAGINLQGE
ncbi:MAG TPA: hypothetical protein VM124_03920 [Candidatus Limnocylindrales bacterium]|nr:hypothetical protein [Candidatus Limnocylindrales bacterium]